MLAPVVALALVAAPLAFLPSAASADTGSSLLGSPFNGSDGVLDSGMTKAPDPVGTADLTNYTGGKEDDLCPPVVQGTASSKNDFDYTSSAAQSTPDGVFVYLAWHRGDGQGGTTSMDFELNQSTMLACNHNNPVRTAGDLLVGYDFMGNSTVPTLTIRTWDGSQWVAQSAAQKALLAANSEASGGENGSFGELVINMTGAGIFDPHECEDLATAFAKSRSSTSFSSEIKDFTTPIGLRASNCGSIDFHKVDDAGAAIGGVTFTLYADANGSQGAALNPAKACTTDSGGDCTIDDIWPGQYWVAETNVPSTNTAVAPFPITVGLTSNSLPDPVRVVNPRKPVHVALHKQDDAHAPMSGVQFGLSTDQTAAHVVGGGTCTTNNSGDCTITTTVDAGDYWVVEISSPDGYHVAPPLAVHLVPGASINGDNTLQFTDTRKTSHIVLDKKVNGVDTSAGAPLDAETGSTLTYSLTITNNGELPLTISALTDTLKNPLPPSCPALGSSLAAGASVTCTYSAMAADPGSPSIVHNAAAVTGVDLFGRTPSSQDDTYVHILNPAIHVVKQADASTVHLGDTVHYTLTVTNPGNTPLKNVTVTDEKCDAPPALASKQGGDDWLDPGETWVFGCSHQTTEADQASVLNTAVASGTDRLGFTVDSTGQVTTAIINPAIDLTKTGPLTAHVGDSLVYTLTVTNPGDTPLHGVVVTDGQCDGDPVRTARDGKDDVLDPGEVWVYRCSHVVVEGDHDPFVNQAHVVGTDILEAPVSADARWSTDILRPEIHLAKDAPDVAHVGDSLLYTLTVTNPGDAALHDVAIRDALCDTEPSLTSKQGDDDLLDPGETWVYQCSHVVADGDPDSLVNHASVSGTDPLGQVVDSPASATTAILRPVIHIVKTGPASAHVGDAVTYTLTVTNPGNTDLFGVTAVDPRCDSKPVLGTADEDGILSPGETWTYTCPHVVVAGDGDQILNVATATGHDRMEQDVSDRASATTDILKPAIAITKTGPSSVHVGDAVVYTLTVTNPGNTPLADVAVSDPKCDGLPVQDGTDADGLLSPGETWTFHCTHVATVADGTSILNTATAQGTDPLGETVHNSANQTAVVLHPAITIDKTASPDSISGSGSVTYTYVVTNTGDATLSDVLVTDDILGPIGHLGTLAPGQSVTLTKTVDVDTSTPPTNIGTATGTDVLGEAVTASDSATIAVVLGEQLTRPAPAPELPRTGAPLEAETRAALALIEVGIILEMSGRRRRRTRRRAD